MVSELKAGVCINYASIVIRLSTAFFLTPFVISQLGVNEYGIFMLSNSVIAWLSLTDFGLGGTVSKYVATYRAKGQEAQQAHFLGQSMLLFSLLGVLTLIVGIVGFVYLGSIFPDLNEQEYHTLRILYLLTLSNLILAFPLRPLGCVPWAYQRFIIPGMISLGNSVLNASLTVLLLFMGYKAIGLTILNVSLSVFGLFWGLWYTFRSLDAKITFSKPDIPLYREMLTFSFWMFLNQIMDLFYWRAGTPILARVAGMEAVTLFTIGISFAQHFMTASTAISGVFAPKLMHMVALDADKKTLTQVMIKVGRLQLFLLAVFLLGFFCLGKLFLTLWVGKSIGDEVGTVWLGAFFVLITLLVPLTQNTGISILQALNIHKGRAIILFWTSFICVVMGFTLSTFWGAIGMFIGTAVSLLFGQCFMINLYYAKKAGLHIRSYFKETYLPILLPASFLLLIGYFGFLYLDKSNSWTSFFSAGILYAFLCLSILWGFYLHREERNIFTSPFRFFLKKLRLMK